jgi:hypothetical protein
VANKLFAYPGGLGYHKSFIDISQEVFFIQPESIFFPILQGFGDERKDVIGFVFIEDCQLELGFGLCAHHDGTGTRGTVYATPLTVLV